MPFLRFLVLSLLVSPLLAAATPADVLSSDYTEIIRPLVESYCLDCHDAETQKGDLDLERFGDFQSIRADPHAWELVDEQLELGEMPPKDKKQPSDEERVRLVDWVKSTLAALAREQAGDPGPVVLRRLSNAEFTSTIRDLTGVDSLDPAREFPVDGAAGEGFSNAGAALVMSPALLTRYLDASKNIADHAVLLPDGLRFSPSTSRRDWTEESLAAIRDFYARFTESGGATPVNLQGIQFETNAGGRLPVEDFLAATLAERENLMSGQTSIADVAAKYKLSAKYLGILWHALTANEPSAVLEVIRARWRDASPGDAPALATAVAEWQRALWTFTTVGHIGKKDGPTAWQVPVTPLASGQDFRVEIKPPADGGDVTFYLVTTDAGDGNTDDNAVWENPRIGIPGRPDLPLRELRGVAASLVEFRTELFSRTADYLAAAKAIETNAASMEAEVKSRNLDPQALSAWLECLGIAGGAAMIDSYLTNRSERAESYDFIKGWAGPDAISVSANSSDEFVRVPGDVKPHSVVVHPAPTRRVLVGWRSPIDGNLRIGGSVQHAHLACGNGIAWALQLRRGNSRRILAEGIAQDATVFPIPAIENLAVHIGDLIVLAVSPRDSDHTCDLTALELTLDDGTRDWDLGRDVSPDILAGNPHADRHGNADVWHFFSEPVDGTSTAPALPAGSVLAQWQATPKERARLATAAQRLLTEGPIGLAPDAPDAILYRQLAALSGPLLSSPRDAVALNSNASTDSAYGLDPKLFDGDDLRVSAPSVIEFRLPADLAPSGVFVTRATPDPKTGAKGSVQMRVLTEKPGNLAGLTAGSPQTVGGKSTWSDGVLPVVSDSPDLATDGSAVRARMEAGFDAFRELFPIALCYTKIVPVDEVVTLTLFYREDDQLRRLMLDDAQAAELERLWSEMHFVSRDALLLVDAFEQLWQFATQDADPSVFTPMREPIQQRAAAFQKALVDAEPAHVEAVLAFAPRAWRRPLTDAERAHLRSLYRQMRDRDELPHDTALRMLLARVLVAPAFLYKMEKPGVTGRQSPVNDWELATRLSYFLWSSAPDAELIDLAARGKLREPETLVAQTRRMLRDPRVRRLAIEFGTQWLHTREFDQLDEKSERHFPTFAALRGPMNEEPIRFFTDFFQNNARVLSLLDADHTFVNGSLAEHYGIAGIEGEEWRRVENVRAQGRGGILAFGATLARQSGASRTSPILRGNWLCETLLGERLPRPPKDVPVLADEIPEGLTERELTARHSGDPKCAGCHLRIDPFGFAMEAYDAIGRFRQTDANGLAIDTRVSLANGTAFDGLDGIRNYLLTERRDDFVQHFVRKLLGFALGRGVQLSDKPLIEDIAAELQQGNGRIGAAIERIVTSPQFREIRSL